MDRVDAVVIGAGVVGLACARALAQRGLETIVLERNASFGQEISARNSEVIHAGLYYPASALKSSLCVSGRRRLYAYCEQRGVPYRRVGKWVVATDDAQTGKLHALLEQALANEVEGVHIIEGAQARSIEPALRCVAALESSETGIVDAHSLMLSLLGDAERAGAIAVFKTPVKSIRRAASGFVVSAGGEHASDIAAGLVVNAAGLDAQMLAASLEDFPAAAIPQRYLAKGHYFTLSGRSPFSRLIYPIPPVGGLGIHLTLDLAGQARFGPDVHWCDEIDYSVDASLRHRFSDAIRAYWPAVDAERLQPGYSGIRPKLHGPEQSFADFLIQGPETHGFSGLVNLFGIESPGLTSCLSIADEVLTRLELGPETHIH